MLNRLASIAHALELRLFYIAAFIWCNNHRCMLQIKLWKNDYFCARSRYQGQGQVVISHSICAMCLISLPWIHSSGTQILNWYPIHHSHGRAMECLLVVFWRKMTMPWRGCTVAIWTNSIVLSMNSIPDSKVHEANMGPIWGRHLSIKCFEKANMLLTHLCINALGHH